MFNQFTVYRIYIKQCLNKMFCYLLFRKLSISVLAIKFFAVVLNLKNTSQINKQTNKQN